MAASKRFLANYLLKTPASGENHHLGGSFLEVVMDKFNAFASPNCSMWLSLTWQSELFHSSSQCSSNSSTHRRIVELCNSWCGSYYIHVRDWLFRIQITCCKITTQLNQTILQAIIGTMCNAKVGFGKHSTPASTYKGLMKEFLLSTMGNMNFGFALTTSSVVCVAVWKNVLNWPIVPNTWPVKISTNLSKNEVVAFEDAWFQLQQGEALSPRRRFSTIATFSIPRSQFYMPSNPEAHPELRFGKTVCRNPTTPLGKKILSNIGKKRKMDVLQTFLLRV